MLVCEFEPRIVARSKIPTHFTIAHFCYPLLSFTSLFGCFFQVSMCCCFFSILKHFYGRLFGVAFANLFVYPHIWWGNRQTHIVTEMQAIIHTNERMRIATQSAHIYWKNNNIWNRNEMYRQKNRRKKKILTNYHTLWLWFKNRAMNSDTWPSHFFPR